MQLIMCNKSITSIKYAFFTTGKAIKIVVESNAFLIPSNSTKISIIKGVHARESASAC